MIFDQIQQDANQALKAGDKVRLVTLRGVIAAIKYKEIDLRRTLDEGEIVSLIQKQVTQLSEAQLQFEKANRLDLATDYKNQIEIMSVYLPPESTDDELSDQIDIILSENQNLIKDKPQAILGVVMGRLKSRASSARIVEMTKSKLGLS